MTERGKVQHDPRTITDADRLDALEREVRSLAIVLWDGVKFPGGPRGLHLGSRSLRERIDECFFQVRLPKKSRVRPPRRIG